MAEVMAYYRPDSHSASGESSRSQYLATQPMFIKPQSSHSDAPRQTNRKIAVNPTFFDDFSYREESYMDFDSSSVYSSVSTVDSHFSAITEMKGQPDPSRLYLDVHSQQDEFAHLSTMQKRTRQFKKKAVSVGSQFLTMNAIIFGFGTQEKLDQDAATIWWDDVRIRYTVTEDFVASSMPYVPGLKPSLKERLKLPVGFGAGLTDETYLDWVLHKARRFFLILLHLGIPEQIFGIIDGAWDDDDLPVSRKQVGRLALCSKPDEEMDERFWKLQYTFLLKNLEASEHIDYADHETVPLEVLERLPSHGHFNVDKVVKPYGKRKNDFITRISVPSKDDLLLHVETIRSRNISHNNIVDLFASYTQQDVGYLLYRPAPTLTLDAFFRSPAYFISAMSVKEKRVMAFNWITGLTSAIAFLHSKSIRHGDINPLSIFVLNDGSKLMLCDAGPVLGTLDVFNRQARSDIRDEYGAPEDYTDAAGLASLFNEQPFLSTDPSLLCKSDVFSLACVIVDVLTFVSRHKMSTYKNHRRRSSTIDIARLSSSSSLGSSGSGRSVRTVFPSTSTVFSKSTATITHTDTPRERPLSFGSLRGVDSRRDSEAKSASQINKKKPEISFRANMISVRGWCDMLVESAEEKDTDGTGDAVVRELIALCCRGMFTEKPRERMGSGAVISRLGVLTDRLRKLLSDFDHKTVENKQ